MDFEQLKRLDEAATPGEWVPCHHLKSAAHDASCPCGYRGGVFGGDKEHMVFEMGSTSIPGQEGLEVPRYDRPTELANAALIIFLRNSVPAILALKEENERLKKALGQALSQGVPPQIPRLTTKDIVTMFSEDEEASVRDWEKYLQQTIPFGDDTVEFFSADECSYPANCPELAAYLKGQTEVPQ